MIIITVIKIKLIEDILSFYYFQFFWFLFYVSFMLSLWCLLSRMAGWSTLSCDELGDIALSNVHGSLRRSFIPFAFPRTFAPSPPPARKLTGWADLGGQKGDGEFYALRW